MNTQILIALLLFVAGCSLGCRTNVGDQLPYSGEGVISHTAERVHLKVGETKSTDLYGLRITLVSKSDSDCTVKVTFQREGNNETQATAQEGQFIQFSKALRNRLLVVNIKNEAVDMSLFSFEVKDQ